ncbi:hypothetical protein M1843_15045 [Isoptericola sp. 4D.3]|uniref:Uncharacterized protein n=1 Tax=Isoptericola peretonis TaxID=2918523 RepID=A0ABT0J6E8_9MICO|nr:hypothetical protein [Isoptericola sp. 4D.3]
MTQATQVAPSARAWSVGWRVSACALATSLVTTVLVVALYGHLGGVLPGATGMVVGRVLVAVVVGVPGAALLAALVRRWPVWLQAVAFAAAGAVLGYQVAAWGFVPGTTAYAWLELALGAGAGRWLVAWRDAGRARDEAADPDASVGPGGAGRPAVGARRAAVDGLGWESPLAWLVASLGLLLAPLWSGFAATITLASFFGEPPTESDHAQAAGLLWLGAGAAALAVVVVLVLAHRVRSRGGRLRGGVTLPALGAVVAVVLAGAADATT